MPPRSHVSLLKRASSLADSPFICPSCFHARASLSRAGANNIYNRRTQPTTTIFRHAATTSTPPRSSIVNATNNVPEKYRELYEALDQLKDSAAQHVNLSRLQLALRGLESETPVIRVAVLGLADTETAVKLVRILLADPLGKSADWESELLSHDFGGSSGFIIRYGSSFEVEPVDGLLPTVSIPSPVLRNGNLEILVSSLHTDVNFSDSSDSQSLQTPIVSIPSADGETHTAIQYPVHKSVLCGRGADGLLAYSEYIGSSKAMDPDSTRTVFDLGLRQAPDSRRGVAFVDIEQAELALETFRQSAQNAGEYQRRWSNSGIQPLLDWVSEPSRGGVMHPKLRKLLDSVLSQADGNIAKHIKKARTLQEKSLVSEAVRTALSSDVSSWAERGHTELRDSLDEAFRSRQWNNLAWWKLFWRVDDIGIICSHMVNKHWLVRSEVEGIWIGGKFHQAGLLKQGIETLPNEETSSATASNECQPSTATTNLGWPKRIANSRNELVSTTVTALSASAQKLVLSTISTASLTSAISALAYMSTTSTSLYEVGTVAAVGLIYSLRRQQKRWEKARQHWESQVRDEGRQTLKETEAGMRNTLQDAGRQEVAPSVEDEDAGRSIETAKKALTNVS